MRWAVVATFCAALFVQPAAAQTVRGVVVDEGGVPVPGVILQLLDSASKSTARGLTDERGEFRLVAPRAGRYRISTLRIGFRPSISEAVSLPSGGDVTQRLALSGVRLALELEGMRVEDRRVCRSFSDSAAATFAIWEQVRAALTATDITARSRGIAATTVAYDRVLEPGGNRVRSQRSLVRTEYVTQPWRALSPDSLHRFGYVIDQQDGSTMYYAPGLDMLLSPLFVEDHCFRLKSERTRIGIAFEPTPDRKDAHEIRGTLWLDRASSELRNIEFNFTGLPSEQADAAAASMAFVRLRDGAWAVGSWNLRMPLMQQRILPQAMGGISLHVVQIQATGGELALARRGNDTLFALPPLVLKGTVRDSLSGTAVAGARVAVAGTALFGTSDSRGQFAVNGLLPGEYSVETSTPSLDSVHAVHQSSVVFSTADTRLDLRVPTGQQIQSALCGSALDGNSPGIVAGTVRVLGDTALPKNVHVVAEWDVYSVRQAPTQVAAEAQHRWVETHADPHGLFRLCGVPLNTPLTVRAEGDAGGAAPMGVRLDDSRVARVDLTMDATTSRGATLTGVVVDSAGQPMFAAEVAIPDASKLTATDAHGAFRLTDVPPGPHRLVVRRVGYGALDTPLLFAANQTVDRRIVLSHVVVLDSVVTVAEHVDPLLRDFEENKRLGLGHFLTRADLAKVESVRMGSILEQVPGAAILHGPQGHDYILAKRAPPTLCTTAACYEAAGYYVGYGGEKVPIACYALVYLDGAAVNRGPPTFPFDVNSMHPSQIEAMEYYGSPAETPAKYQVLGSACGVLVIHTRRP